MNNLRGWLKKIIIISLELLLISGALWYVAEKRGVDSSSQIMPALQKAAWQTTQTIEEKIEKPFPVETDPIKKNYTWQYKGKTYSLDVTLYKSSYDYYRAQPKTFSYNGELPIDWEEDFYGMFLKSAPEDQTIVRLANDLRNLGLKNKLTDDQIIELTLAFVQSIQYDDAKARDILAKDNSASISYPYEVLFEQLGVCSDKSILTAALLRQMGYGAALFAYEDDNHMAVAVECSKNSSTYGSGYCFAETTATGNKIGILPSFDQVSNKTVSLSDFDNNQEQSLKQLGQVTIFQKTSGKLYGGVTATEKIIAEISQLKKEIDSALPTLKSLKKKVSDQENELADMRSNLESYRKSQNIEKFNALVEKYNDLLETYKKDLKKYNSSVTLYNQTIARYNVLIRQ